MKIDEEMREKMWMARMCLRWSETDAAQHLEVHPSTYQRWENGIQTDCSKPHYQAIIRLIRYGTTSDAIHNACHRVQQAYQNGSQDARAILTRRVHNTVIAALEYLGRERGN